MMKKSFVFTVTLAFVLLCLLTGCGKEPLPEKKAVCFAVAATSNTMGLNLSNPFVKDTCFLTARGYGYAAVISIDGNPELVFEKSFDVKESEKSARDVKLNNDAKTRSASFIKKLGSVTANDEEVSYLEALRLASRMLSSLDGFVTKEIIVIGSGLSTCGDLKFQNNLLSDSVEPEAIVKRLAEKELIPDFSGITVHFLQLGDVTDPQPELSQAQIKKLEAIYRGIIETGGGEFKAYSYIGTPVSENVTYPYVSVVELSQDEPDWFYPDDKATETIDYDELNNRGLVLHEKSIAFYDDSDDYLYPDQALAVLSPIAELLKTVDEDILVVGTTAGDVNSTEALTLSKMRSEKVKKSLTDLGVSPDSITAIGLGSDNPWHVPGLGVGEEGAVNRSCILLSMDSPIAKTILEKSEGD